MKRNPARTARSPLRNTLGAFAGLALALVTACQSPAAPTLTAVPPPTSPAPAASPLASPVASPTSALPPWPGDLDRAENALLAFLNSGAGQRAQVPALLSAWDDAQRARNVPVELPRSGLIEADTDADGQPELIVGLVDANAMVSTAGPSGRVFVVHGSGTSHRVIELPQGNQAPDRAGPYLAQAADANGDRGAEILYTSTLCGGSTCTGFVHAATWAGGSYRLATPPDLQMSFANVSMVDRDGDGRLELVLEGGLMGSAGAGVQRSRTEIYRWVGGRFELAETAYAPSTLRYFTVMDANDAFERKDWRAAISLYERAATDMSLSDERQPPGPDPGPGLRAYSRFRLLLIHAIQGNDAAARGVLEDMQRLDSATPYPAAAQPFWHTYGQTGDLETACEQFTQSAERQPALLEPLNNWGYANGPVRPEDLCVVP